MRSAVDAEEGSAYDSVANGSLAHGWVDWRGGNGLDVVGPQTNRSSLACIRSGSLGSTNVLRSFDPD